MKFIFAIFTLFFAFMSVPVLSAEEAKHPREMVWPFDGMFGTLDRQSAQRGFQVYKEVCSSCHALHRVAFRSLRGIGITEPEIKALASTYTVVDGPNEEGEMFDRPGRASDKFVPPFANEQAARSANGGAYPPDLSLITKSREDGPNYLYSLLTGYKEPPAGKVIPEGLHYNPYFPMGQIAMPAPLVSDGQVTYADGTTATVDQMARDVTVFLQWAAEPEMEQRKSMGVRTLLFLAIMTLFFYIAKRRIWRDIH